MTGTSGSSGDGSDELRRVFDRFLTISDKDSHTAMAAEAGVQIRYRPPYKCSNKYDAREDGIALAIDNMLERGVPLWAANIAGRQFVKDCADQHHLAKIEFDDDNYEPLPAQIWCANVTTAFETYAQKFSRGELPLPVKPVEWDAFPYSLYSSKNKKSKMEDRHLVLPSLAVVEPPFNETLKNDALFGVFDGHNGSDCAAYAATHMTQCLLEVVPQIDGDKSILLERVFRLLDERLTYRCEKEQLKSGSTAACAYISDNTAYLAWVGDSSIGIMRPNEVVTVSVRHSPGVPSERTRIEQAGGMVLLVDGEPRVNAVLNVSRSLGDLNGRPMISQDPDVLAMPIDGANDFIMFLSSDGIWDTLTEANVFKCVRKFITTRPHTDYKKLADCLGQLAISQGATDNLTMIVVFLDTPENVWEKVKESIRIAAAAIPNITPAKTSPMKPFFPQDDD